MCRSLTFRGKKCYPSLILDMATSEIVSYDLALSPNMKQIKWIPDSVSKKFPNVTGLLFHLNQGWQYRHPYYQERLKERGIIQSISRKGNCYDNGNFLWRIKE